MAYSPTCPHCIDFMPTYRRMAATLRSWYGWGPMVAILDTSNPRNQPIVRQLAIRTVPTFFVVRNGRLLPYRGDQNPQDLIAAMTKPVIVERQSVDQAVTVPFPWPSVLPFRSVQRKADRPSYFSLSKPLA